MRKAASVAAIVVLFTLTMQGAAPGYPQGWTSDNLVATGTGSVDISVKGDTVHLVYENNGVYYRRSTDRGVSWSNAARLDAGTGASPQVTAGAGNTVYAAYVGEERPGAVVPEVLVKRSLTGGQTWDAGYYAYASSSTDRVKSVFITHGCDNVSVCWQVDVANHCYIYWTPLYRGDLSPGRRQVWDESTDYMDKPRIASDGTNVFIAYMAHDKEYYHWNIYCMRHDGSTTTRDIIADESTRDLRDPDVSCQGPGLFNVVWTEKIDGENKVCQKRWTGSSWTGRSVVLNAFSQQPVPRAVPFSTDDSVICRDGSGNCLDWAIFGLNLEVFKCSPPEFWATDHLPMGDTFVVVRSADSRIRVKRNDLQGPSADGIEIEGNLDNETLYAKAGFTIAFNNPIDDWNATGSDSNGDHFTDGVSSIHMKCSRDQKGPWGNLNENNIIENSPWIAVAETNDMGDEIWYIKGIIFDTAGNTTEVVSGPVVLDKTLPTCSVSTDPPLDPGTWRSSPTTVTIHASDVNLDRIEYRVQQAGGTAGNWAAYDGPFTAPEGRNTIFYRAIDKAGNSSDPNSSLEVWVDTGAPVCSVVFPKTRAHPPVDGTTLIVKGNIDDGDGEVVSGSIWVDGKRICQVDHPESTLIAAPWDTGGKALGEHTVEIRATDAAGHGSSSGSRVFQLVESPAVHWYFAEGNTRKDFEEYICVLDAGDRDARVSFDLMLETGQTLTRTATVAKRSRATFNVRDMVDGEHDVSIHLHTDGQPVIAERPMYFNYRGRWTGGHTALGANELKKKYYFSEGTTRREGNGGPFEEWLCVQNPGPEAARVKVTYMLADGRNVMKPYEVGPRSRKTINVNEDVGPDQDVSAVVESDRPVAAERPMYFAFQGAVDGGHLVPGAGEPSRTWYFAEGTTRAGFREYVTIQNPNDVTASCELTFYLEDRSREKVRLTIPKRTRATCDVLAAVGAGHDVSAKVDSDLPVIAERPMYFNYQGKWTGGHATLGSTRLGRSFYLAEGTTRGGFDEWVTVFSSSSGAVAQVVLIYEDGSRSDPLAYPVGRSHRTTIHINSVAEGERDVSLLVVGDNEIAVERPMYFSYRGSWTGGHIAAGFSSE